MGLVTWRAGTGRVPRRTAVRSPRSRSSSRSHRVRGVGRACRPACRTPGRSAARPSRSARPTRSRRHRGPTRTTEARRRGAGAGGTARATRACPARPKACRSSGSLSSSCNRVAHSSTVSTRYPLTPSSSCKGIPPARPATTGVPFQSASDTTKPKPSRSDFWTTTSARRWKAFTSTFPTPVKLVNTWMSGSASTSRWIRR